MTPTAISHQIRLLEETCGQSLFQRRPRPLVLTSVGERLFPTLRNGFDDFANAIASIAEDGKSKQLRVTSPNAFASRWLVPRLPRWREANPDTHLEIIGTDRVLDLRAGEADVAMRYARRKPTDLEGREIFRDRFFPVCSPALLACIGRPIESAADLMRYPLIHFDWMSQDPDAPTWRQWLTAARMVDPGLAEFSRSSDLTFREELHAIDALVAGQGIAICSDLVVGRELQSGALVRAHALSLPGYGYYLVHLANHPRQPAIEAFSAWLRSAA